MIKLVRINVFITSFAKELQRDFSNVSFRSFRGTFVEINIRWFLYDLEKRISYIKPLLFWYMYSVCIWKLAGMVPFSVLSYLTHKLNFCGFGFIIDLFVVVVHCSHSPTPLCQIWCNFKNWWRCFNFVLINSCLHVHLMGICKCLQKKTSLSNKVKTCKKVLFR